MNIQILHSWLSEYLETNAKPADIAKYVSLSGPSFEKTSKKGRDYLYDIEITTNRVDSMSVVGVARECASILPEFGFKAKLKAPKAVISSKKSSSYKESIKLINNQKLSSRLMGVVLDNFQGSKTPEWMKTRLEAAGIRSLNPIIDITNYVMLEIGHPAHAFDYDKLKDRTIKVRESKKGEKITTLDNKTYKLPGGDVVFVNKKDEIIDLPGIIGTKNSVIDNKTKRVLFFLDDIDAKKIRQTSMKLNIRTMAATLNEKSVDPELAGLAMARGIYLYKKICKANQVSPIMDVYPKPYKPKKVSVSKQKVEKILGVSVNKRNTLRLLKALDFDAKWNKDELVAVIPSFRSNDINIGEDLVEEIARIYGYHNLPSELMEGGLPEPRIDTHFDLEFRIKNIIKFLGGIEVYSYPLVDKKMAGEGALRLKNPLGSDTEYLRQSLKPSLLKAAIKNKGNAQNYHLFEMANVYLPKKGKLPEEKLVLGGIFADTKFLKAKSVVETLLKELNINFKINPEDKKGYSRHKHLIYSTEDEVLGTLGELKSKYIYYELSVSELIKYYTEFSSFTPIPKFPAQVEDVTIEIPKGVYVLEIYNFLKKSHKNIVEVKLIDTYKRSFTFKIFYQSNKKTLTDKDVEGIRNKVEDRLDKKYNLRFKT